MPLTNRHITNSLVRSVLAEELRSNRQINREHMRRYPHCTFGLKDDEAGIRNMALALDMALFHEQFDRCLKATEEA